MYITLEQMKKLARYEMDFGGFDLDELGPSDVQFEGDYQMTLDDVLAALDNLEKKNPKAYDVWEDWAFYLLEAFEEQFGTAYIDEDDDLPTNEHAVLTGVLYSISDATEEYTEDDDTRVRGFHFFDDCRDDIAIFLRNKGLPIEKMELTNGEKLGYIRELDDDDILNEASEEKLRLARIFIEQLCEKDDIVALRLKGYACYGGNRLYECDWHASRACIERLYELTDDPQYANTLGYIYYYGRCNCGEPEYDKAFKMFAVSAANGLYEGMYKLGDMYAHGYGCKKSPKTARKLYEFVFDDSRNAFVNGAHDNQFADAALRMGNVYQNGMGARPDNVSAYIFYLIADHAAKLRCEENDFFGNITVAKNAAKALEEAKAKLHEDYFVRELIDPYMGFIDELTDNGYRAEVSARVSGGKTKLVFKRVKKHDEKAPAPILQVVGRYGYCDLVTKVEYTAEDCTLSKEFSENKTVRYDAYDFDTFKNTLTLYFDGEVAGRIQAEAFILKRPTAKRRQR